MAQAKQGDTVKVHYTGKLGDGRVFDSSVDQEPLQFTLGRGQIISGFEDAVVGMIPGESKTILIPAERAYGKHIPEMVLEVERTELPVGLSPKVGQQLRIGRADGRSFVVLVIAVTENMITLDGNHLLAGKDLTFDIELVEIV